MIKRLLLLLFIFGLYYKTLATHIVGGDFTYRRLSANNFELNLTLFRDCNSATLFDASITVGIFDKVTDQLTDSLVMQLTSTDSLNLAGSLCSPPPDICVVSGTYTLTINLPDNANGYYLSWERCCRNHTVVNLFNPGATGLTFYTEMPDPAIPNSSPVFQNDPLPYMCENQPFSYDFGGTDPDGDSLVFELVTPYAGNSSQSFPILPAPQSAPYPNAIFLAPYTLSNVCGGTPLVVDPVTGKMTATPNFIGIYAMAMLVREFRNGVQIGLIRREIEFTVIICDGNLLPEATTFSTGLPPDTRNFTVYESDSICFSLSSSDPTDSLFITYSGDCFAGSGISPPFAVTANSSGFKAASTNFCWYTACGQARANAYEINFEIKDNGCPFPKITKFKVTINIKPTPLIPPLNLLCASFEGTDVAKIFWSDNTANGPFFSFYVLYRSVNGGAYSVLDTLYSKQPGFYQDNTAFDYINNNYCYYIVSVNTCMDIGLASDTLCTDDAKNDKANYIESVSVLSKDKIQLKIEHFPDGPYYTFFIYRKENDSFSPFSLYKTVNGIIGDTWIDEEVNTNEKSYCYYIINQDACGNVSPASQVACSILLKGSSVPFLNSITWTEYINWRGGVFDYEIYRKTNNLPNFSKLIKVEYLVFNFDDENLDYDNGKYTYQIRATEGAGGNNAESYSNEVELTQQPLVFAPNAFTPNNDNANEAWGVTSIFIKDYILRIFNRYGEVVFSSTDKHTEWDGLFKGKPAPQGVYIYEVRYNSFYNEKQTRKAGSITLLR